MSIVTYFVPLVEVLAIYRLPIYAVTVGVAAGRNIKSLWYQPAVTSVLFLIGIGVFFETIDSAFIMYAFSYLVLGMLAAVISGVVRKRAH